MGFKFNPFSGTFDATGASDAAPFAGQVDAYADLPLDSTAALNSRWLVKNNSGTWPFSTYKQAGIYIRVNTVGASRDNDYQFVGTLPSVMNDNEFLIYDDADATKNLKFQLSGISTGTTRTLTAPDASGTLGWLQSVSSITVSTDHQLTAARNQRVRVNSTSSGSGASVYLPSTGNAEGDRLEVACVGLAAGTLSVRTGQYDFTVSTSMGLNEQRTFIYASGSWTLGSVESHTHAGLGPTFASSAFQVTEPSGIVTNRLAFSLSGITAGATRTLTVPDNNGTIALTSNFAAPPAIGSTTPAAGSFTTLSATGTTELVNGGTTAGPFRLYNISSAANANFERLSLRWASNVAIIGTEKAGTGSARALEFQTDGVTRMTVAASGAFGTVTINGVLANRALATNTWAAVDSLNSSGQQVGGFGYGGTGVSNFPDQMYFGSMGKDLVLAIAVNGTNNPIIVNGSTGLLSFYGKTNAFPALKRSSTTLQVRLANDSDFAPFECAGLTLNGNLTASTRNIVTDTTTGTKIGTATTQKIGFFNATPVVQQAAIADATDAATTQARLNDLLATMRTFGLIAT